MLQSRIAVKIAFFINGFIYANWTSRLPRIQEIYGAADGDISLVLLSSAAGAVAAMPFAGWFIIKNGSRRITLVTAILYCIFVPLIPILPNLAALMALYFIMGVATGMLDVAMNAQAVVVERAYKKPIMSSFHALFSIGMGAGALCGVIFSKLESSLEIHFTLVVLTALLALLWASRNLIRDRPDPRTKPEGPLFRLPNTSLISIGVITFCCMLGEGAMSEWSVNFMENIVGADKAVAPIALAAFATAMTLGRIFGDQVRLKTSDRKMIIAGGAMATVGLGLPLIVPATALSITGCFLVGLGLSTIVPIGYSIAGNTKDLPSGVGLAMVTTVGYSGFLFGPPVIGFISEWQNIRIALVAVAALFLIMTILGIRYRAKT